ncbi:hypothetical protein Q9L58_008682 [Maublancomyces gigas]|uniref:Uncharacterized protein n=1 Tax=Discina gigas TaxID=1032678 RepID=A0ABR3G8Z7_9PEZI
MTFQFSDVYSLPSATGSQTRKQITRPPPHSLAISHDDLPIHRAAHNGDIATLRLLLEAKTPVDQQNSDGMTALMSILERPTSSLSLHFSTVEFLLNNSANPDPVGIVCSSCRDLEAYPSPIMYAVYYDLEKVVSSLIANKANVDARCCGYSVLGIALLRRDELIHDNNEVAAILVDQQRTSNSNIIQLLGSVGAHECLLGIPKILSTQTLVSCGCCPHLMHAAYHDASNTVARLATTEYIDQLYQGYSVLSIARQRQTEILSIHNAEINKANADIIQILRSRGAHEFFPSLSSIFSSGSTTNPETVRMSLYGNHVTHKLE